MTVSMPILRAMLDIDVPATLELWLGRLDRLIAAIERLAAAIEAT